MQTSMSYTGQFPPMLGRGGLLGNDASLNAARDETEQHPHVTKQRSSRSALGAVAPLAGAFGVGVAGQSSIAEPAEPKPPGVSWRKAQQLL